MNSFRKAFSFHLILSLALVGMLQAPLWADESDTDPALGVARVSLTNGDVTVQRGNSSDWIEAPVNTPLVAGDTLATGPASRAEIQLDHSNFLRLGEQAEVYLAELGNRRFQVQVTRGLVTYVELHGGEADVEIETPNIAVRPMKNGSYRIQVFENGETEVTVRKGKAEIVSSQGSEELKQGQTMLVRVNPADGSVEFQTAKASSPDDWDRWSDQRDKQLKRSASYQRVSRDIYGVADLDPHGRWVYVSGYGHCWAPSVADGWVPYRYGRWVWLDYYGWTWVSYEPWGWAPYHYGRWYHHASFGWVWYPGHRHHRHHWRPALVAFLGYGSHSGFHFGVNFGFGHIGWIPLGPRDPYYPWYGRRHRHHGRHVTINIYNIYQNARVRGGITVLDADDFSRGRRRFRSAGREDLRRARLIQGELPIVPRREALGRVARRSRPDVERRRAAGRARFDARRISARSGRVPFERQQERIVARMRGTSGRAGNTRSSAGAEERNWRRFRDTSSRATYTALENSFAGRSRPEATPRDISGRSSRGNWRSFDSTEGNVERTRSRVRGNSRSERPRNEAAPADSTQRNNRRSWRSFQPAARDGDRERSRSRVNSRSERSTLRREERTRSTRGFSSGEPQTDRENQSRERRVAPPRRSGSTGSARVTRQSRQAPSRTRADRAREVKRPAARSTKGSSRGKAAPRRTGKADPGPRKARQRP